MARWKFVPALVAVFVLGSVTAVLATHVSSTAPTYSGCLNTTTGAVSKLKRGNNPVSACASGETSIHLSGGDITSVLAAPGGGLTGGATAGNATLGIDFAALDARYGSGSTARRPCYHIPAGSGAQLSYCYLRHVSGWDGVTLYQANLASADLMGSVLSGINGFSANFSGANLQYTDLRNSHLANTNFTNANLYGALMTDANTTTTIWSNTTCPDGTNSNANGGTCAGHLSMP